MNKKDYKEIAKVMRLHIKENDNDLKHPAMTKERYDDVARFIETICHQLADYFEKEERNEIRRLKYNPKNALNTVTFSRSVIKDWKEFNREQFLKDCGVD